MPVILSCVTHADTSIVYHASDIVLWHTYADTSIVYHASDIVLCHIC